MKNRNVIFGLIVISLSFSSCIEKQKKSNIKKEEKLVVIKEQYRPNFHFTPKANWMNDPNGMFYLNGKYHLYFQYYPDDTVWGPMHWGHAISEDMVVWKEQPIAIYPDSLGYIFSGSAVVDHNNSSGLGKEGVPPVISMFTYHDPAGEKNGTIDFQSQAIAYSLDEGLTFEKFIGNPVIPNPGIKDFRDPKVYFDKERDQWLMVLATYEESLFYSSKNFIDWEFLSTFGKGIGAHGGVWECPDFFPMKVSGSDHTKWVLIQSIGRGFINGGSGTQYFVGDFDGKQFTLDPEFENELMDDEGIWIDYGRDNYAGVTWSNIPAEDGRKLFIGWMSNWHYATSVPTKTWRSAMTVARELNLVKHGNSYRLISQPVKELDNYLTRVLTRTESQKGNNFQLYDNADGITHHQIELNLSNLQEERYAFELSNANNEKLLLGIDKNRGEYFFDRRQTGQVDFEEKYADRISKAPVEEESDQLKVKLLIDEMSIEVFYNNGKTIFTEIFFPNIPFTNLKLSSNTKFEISELIVKEFNQKK